MRKRLFTISVLTIVGLHTITAQLIDTYQFPPSVKWRHIKSENFDIIFTDSLSAEAQNVTNILEHCKIPISASLNNSANGCPLILSNQNTMSNAYVAFGPRRSEFFSTPPQNPFLGTGNWYEMLALHEGRHMVQVNKFTNNYGRILSILFGDWGAAVFSNYIFPNWFWEGDAVVTETALSECGRGRLPVFDRDFRAISLAGKKYSYFKAYNRSYRDYVPNQYPLGYLMLTHLRRQYGNDVLSRVADHSTNWGFALYPLNKALKKETGGKVRHLYKKTMLELDSLWQQQVNSLQLSPFKTVSTKPKKCYTNYQYPQYVNDSTIIAQKYGMNHSLRFVKIDSSGNEVQLTRFEPVEQTTVSIASETMVWNEVVPDIRWGTRDYSVLVTYNIKTGERRRITTKSKLLAPALSADSKLIAAVEITQSRKFCIVIVDAQTGQELNRLPNPENRFISTPTWSPSGQEIVYVAQGDNRKTIAVQNVASGCTKLFPFNYENVANPVFYGKYILYNSPFSGIDNINAIDTVTSEKYQVTSDKIGAYYPAISPNGKLLAYSSYTVDGFNVVETDLNPMLWKNITSVDVRDIGYYKPIVAKEGVGDILSNIPQQAYNTEPYDKFLNIVKPHSWAYFPLPPFLTATVMSTNLLNTMSLSASGTYNSNDRSYSAGLSGTYSGLYPIFKFGVTKTLRFDSLKTDHKIKDRWIEQDANFGVSLPFNLSLGVYNTQLLLETDYTYREVTGKNPLFDIDHSVNKGRMQLLGYQLSFQNSTGATMRDINPPFKQTFRASYSNTPFSGDSYSGTFLSVGTQLFLPGILPHHSIRIAGNFEEQHSAENYWFASKFKFPRGYKHYYHQQFVMGSIDYAFPIVFTDWHLGHLLYIKQFKGDAYYDYGVGTYNSQSFHYQSVGSTVTMGIIPVSLAPQFEFEIGARYSYLISTGTYVIEPVLGLYF